MLRVSHISQEGDLGGTRAGGRNPDARPRDPPGRRARKRRLGPEGKIQ